MKDLPNTFYAFPKHANFTTDKATLKRILLETEGWIFACGELYDIVSKHLGAGIYRVSLKSRY